MIYPLEKFTETQWFNRPPGHGGLDMAAPYNTAIRSPVTGVVIGDGEDSGYIGGKYVIVRESAPRGYEFYMGHMTSNSVVRGEKVREGELIGRVGKTGKATGYHVHFQIRRKGGGALIDPKSLRYDKVGGDMATIKELEKRLLEVREQRNNWKNKYEAVKKDRDEWYNRAQELRSQRNSWKQKAQDAYNKVIEEIKKALNELRNK